MSGALALTYEEQAEVIQRLGKDLDNADARVKGMKKENRDIKKFLDQCDLEDFYERQKLIARVRGLEQIRSDVRALLDGLGPEARVTVASVRRALAGKRGNDAEASR